jgi:uncharacterized membrane protein
MIQNWLKRKKKSAPGMDQITYHMLKIFTCFHTFLAKIYNRILATGTFPEIWKTAIASLIYKKGEANIPKHFIPQK